MKKFNYISIVTLIISMFACCFVFANNKILNVQAADVAAQDCFYLVDENGNPYQANISVGKIEGTGKFLVGETDVVLTATANDNYKIVGWQVTYLEQSNKTEFVDALSLAEGKKTIELTAKDGATKTNAIIEFLIKDNVYYMSTFKIENVFEDMIIRPVFDHIYYSLVISELTQFASLNNSLAIGENILFYETSNEALGITTYSNSYIKIGEDFYYYGNLYYDGTKYYTIHQTISDDAEEQHIEYSIGAFRVGDNVKFDLDVDIVENDLASSKNIDFINASLISDSTIDLTKNETPEVVNNSYKIEKDNFLRTTNVAFDFAIAASKSQKNVLDVTVHDLFIADINILVDGSTAHGEESDIFGSTIVKTNEILSNISIYNFYSRTKNNNQQFLIKKAQDNDSKSFGIICAQNVEKTIDGVNYKYYDFKSLDETDNQTQYYGNVSQNIEINIEYSATRFDIEFACAEFVKNPDDSSNLFAMAGNTLEVITKTRGETVSLTEADVVDVKNVGYRFVGFAHSLTSSVQSTIAYQVNREKPQGTTIYLCFEKIEYDIVFANYNKIGTVGAYPLSSISFKINGVELLSETLNSADLVGNSVTLSNKIKVGSTLNISFVLNEGFNIKGFSLKNPAEVADGDYFNVRLEFDAEIIEANNITNTLTLYVYEEFNKYTITYFINPEHDNNVDDNVIMAELSAESAGATIEKYDAENNLISEANNNLTAFVAKIIISNLNYNAQVVLKSKPFSGNDGEKDYLYVFNWFTEDDKSTLSYVVDGEYYNHTETVVRNREIKVVYSMPTTKILVALEEDFATNPYFLFTYSILSSGSPLEPDAGNNNLYAIAVGLTVTISITSLDFGYNFVGYSHVEQDEYVAVNNFTFDFVTKIGVNTILLDFERIEYHFIFTQSGANKDGEQVLFNGKNFVSLNVDNTSVTIEKPLGYYVSNVLFGEDGDDEYSEVLSEDNSYRSNEGNQTYYFNLTREDFINAVTAYGKLNAQNVSEIDIEIKYEIFKYLVQVNYGITNPKGDSRDDYVIYPTMDLRFEFEGENKLAPIDTSYGVNTLVFIEIPYNSKVTMTLTSSAPSGFSLSGWYTADGQRISNEFACSLNDLTIDSIILDYIFIYNLSYNAYQINVVYASGQGNPLTYINNNLVIGERKQITLYDKLAIESNALRNNGYIFDKITYKKPKYTVYSYSKDTWEQNYNSLYIQTNGQYQLNASNSYNHLIDYYVYSEEVVELVDSTFADDMFLVSNYALEADNKTIIFTVEYKLLELTIVNTVAEKAPNPTWKLTGRGKKGNGRIEVALSDFALFAITAVDAERQEREILEGNFVTYYDTVTINIQINKFAINVDDGAKYDLTSGLTLDLVRISGKSVGFEEKSKGLYAFTFYVGEYLPASGTQIDISYEFKIAAKKLNVTTIVKDSTEFYKNIKLYANAKDYGFEMSTLVTENNASSLSHNFQFLAKANVYADFTTNTYKTNFVVSGVKIFSDGVELSSLDYANHGIVMNDNKSVDVRFFNDVDVIFIVQPKITYNNGPIFTKSFKCNNEGIGEDQQLSVGETADSDIQIASMLVDLMTLKYISVEPHSVYVDSVQNVGRYDVKITFIENAEFDWLDEIEIAENVVLIIQPKEIYLTYDADILVQVKKVYDGTSGYNVASIYKYLKYTDNKTLNIPYSVILDSATNNLALEKAECYISSLGKDAGVTQANENIYYNLYVYNFSIKDNSFNKNFSLQNSDLIIYNFIQIAKREIKLLNVAIYDKVYDGTDKAELVSTQDIRISNIISGDDISISGSRLNPKFTDPEVGTNKSVKIDALSALVGKDISNYYIAEIETEGLTIYPYSLSTTIKGLGKIEISNRRGLVEKDKIALIPLNATLSVQAIYDGDNQYVSIYSKISKYLKGNNEFAIGYSISFLLNGEKVPIDNNLYLSVPSVKDITGAYFLTGQKTGEINHSTENGNVLIDLTQINGNISHIFMTKTKYLLKPWQIALIVIGAVLIVVAVVMTLIIVRKRKIDRDSVHETI